MGSAERIAIALLAAGRSVRFGKADKLTADLAGRPLIAWAAEAGRSLGAAHHLLVTGPDRAIDAGALGYHLLINDQPQDGMASSLRIAALAAEQAGADALLILLADVPFVTPEHLGRLIAAFREDGVRPVFTSASGGVPQPPALFPAVLFTALQGMEGDKGARGLAADATLIEAGEASLLDVDTPDDLERARHHAATIIRIS